MDTTLSIVQKQLFDNGGNEYMIFIVYATTNAIASIVAVATTLAGATSIAQTYATKNGVTAPITYPS